MKQLKFKSIFFLLFLISGTLLSQVPQTISYQGLLTDAAGVTVTDGDYSIVFTLYDALTDGTNLWTETQTVTVSGGIFNVILGKVTPLTLSFEDPYWLGVSIESGAELTPRTELTSSAYSLNTLAIPNNVVTKEKVADGNLVKSINTLTDNVTLTAGNNVNISESGNTITISASGGSGSSGDNLGNHTATQNIKLGSHFLSGDGENEGVYVKSDGKVGIGTTSPSASLHLNGIDGVLFEGIPGSGTIPKEGYGIRMMWYPKKAAFRAGLVNDAQWNDANIGSYSTAMGHSTTASGKSSTAMGFKTTASAESSTAMGHYTTASDNYSTAMGYYTTASGNYSTAMGYSTTASGTISTAMGIETTASGYISTAMGRTIEASGDYSFAIGLKYSDPKPNVTQDNTMAIMGGNVGIGTVAPTQALDVASRICVRGNHSGSTTSAGIWYAEGDEIGVVKRQFAGVHTHSATGANQKWGIYNGNAWRFIVQGNGNVGVGTETPQGKLDVNGSIFQRGGSLHADYVFENEYKLETIEEHAEFMWKNKHLKAIPKATVDTKGQEVVEVGSHRKGIVEELEKAHIYISQLEESIKKLTKRIEKLEVSSK